MNTLPINTILCGDSLEILKTLPSESVDCAITSPPYWNLRDYQHEGQLGLEKLPKEYIKKLCDTFDEVKRVLKNSGTFFVNICDTYSGNKKGKTDKKVSNYVKESQNNLVKIAPIQEKSLIGIPEMFVLEMQKRKWIRRNTIIWFKPNAMPNSADDRFSQDFEYVYFFVKGGKYTFEQQLEKSKWAELDKRFINGPSSGGKATSGNYAINKGGAFRKDGMRNMRCVWEICTKPFDDAHFAVFPEKLIAPMIKAGCPMGGVCLDPFMGAGTTAVVARKLGRNYLGIELNPAYIKMAEKRLRQEILI